jgi:hypothetical protein
MYGTCKKSFKSRKLKDGQYNEQYKNRSKKTVVHRTMYKQQNMNRHKHKSQKMTCIC